MPGTGPSITGLHPGTRGSSGLCLPVRGPVPRRAASTPRPACSLSLPQATLKDRAGASCSPSPEEGLYKAPSYFRVGEGWGRRFGVQEVTEGFGRLQPSWCMRLATSSHPTIPLWGRAFPTSGSWMETHGASGSWGPGPGLDGQPQGTPPGSPSPRGPAPPGLWSCHLLAAGHCGWAAMHLIALTWISPASMPDTSAVCRL